MKMELKRRTGKITLNSVKVIPYVSNDEDFDLLTDKGVYPYDYFTSFDKFRERQLPPKKTFIATLLKAILKMMSMKEHLIYGNILD